MFKACTIDDILEVLDQHPERFLDEKEELEDLVEEESTEYYCSEDCLLVISPRRRRAEMYAIPLTADFDLDQLEKFAHSKADNFRMHLNVTGMPAEELRFSEPYEVSDPVTSFYTEETREAEAGKARPIGKVRELNANDKRHADHFAPREAGRFMDLKQVFPLLVIDGSGTILGYFTPDGRLLGYLSYVPSMLDVPTLDDIYVLPAERRRGIGSTLAREFVWRTVKNKQPAYWPVADSVEAKKTAEAAGFREAAVRITIETL